MKHVCIPVLFCAVIAGCSTGAGDGSIVGELDLPECGVTTDNYDMDIDFFAASSFNNILTIRLQKTGRDQTVSDGVIIVIRDATAVAQAIGEQGAFSGEIIVEPSLESFLTNGPDQGIPITSSHSAAAVTLYLNDTCPGNTLAFTDGFGSLMLKSIYVPDKTKRITGSFDLDFIDPRYWTEGQSESYQPRAHLRGEFDFNYTRGSPAQIFPVLAH